MTQKTFEIYFRVKLRYAAEEIRNNEKTTAGDIAQLISTVLYVYTEFVCFVCYLTL